MSFANLLAHFREIDSVKSISTARWYLLTSVALAAASAGPQVTELYKKITYDLSWEDEKIVQRRIKEAILKTSCLYGVPKSLQALLPLFETLPDDRIDNFGPRYDSKSSFASIEQKEERGRKYFDTIWTSEAAESMRQRLFKHQPDLYLLNLKMLYDENISEDTILSNIETQMCNVAALICSNSPVQVLWHTKGLIRQGGTLRDAKLAHDIGLAIARFYSCETGHVQGVESIDFDDKGIV